MYQQQLVDDLYSNLLSAVQEIQEQVARGIDVFWNCGAVDRLCYSMDDILSHGLKEGLLSWAASSEVSFWPLAVKITCKKGIEDITRLNLKSDQEKCVSWIRQGLKEHTLGSYINVITQDEKLVREFYHSYAFICDGEKAESVKNLLTYGISHLDFDISLSSSTRRPMSVETKPLLASDAMIGHLPFRSSLVNGYTSPTNNPDEKGIFPSTPNSVMVTSMSENTGKKRKKKRRAEVAMIAESIDSEESKYIDSVIQTKRDFDLTTEEFPNGKDLVSSELKIEDENNQRSECSVPQTISQSEEDSSSRTSLAMELPATEAMSLIVDEETQDDCNAEHVVSNRMKNGPPVTTNKHYNESAYSDEEPVNVKTQLSLKPDVECNITHHLKDEVSTVVSGPSLAASEPSSEDSPSEVLLESRKCSVEAATDDSGATQHRVSLAMLECGTPKQIDDISQIEKDRGLSCTSYEDEDFNIVPGIHKSDGRLSRSGSSGSFTASGSYISRNNTMDSINGFSAFGNSAASDSRKYVATSFSSSSRNNSKTDFGTGSPSSESHFSEYELFDELLGLQEDHFSPPPESFMGVSTSEELTHAIQSCKDLISTSSGDPLERQTLINKLVQLRLRLQETEDSRTENNSDVQKVLGHMFRKEQEPGNKTSCDKCGRTIWMWQSLFTCKACKYHSHRRCLDMIRRPCASRKVSFTMYNLIICPEMGLSSQQYKCAECRKQIALTKGERSEGRLCDYTGQYFCEECHWNDLIIIPARVVHNWDFTTYKVSRQAKQLLALMVPRPLLNIERLNPALFKFVVELREVKRLREEILIMKKYFMACRNALESKLLLQLKDRQHFVDTADMYSLQDLIEVNSGSLLPFLTKIHSLFLTHIKSDCQLCQAKGFVCELCQSSEVIFAFDPHVAQCSDCRSVYHKMCFKAGICPKCERRQKRTQTSQ